MKCAPSPLKSTTRPPCSWTVRGAKSKNKPKQSGVHPEVAAGLDRLIDQLCDIGEGRIANMDAAGIDVQVLSLTAPGVEQLEAVEPVALARVTNDTLAERCTAIRIGLPGSQRCQPRNRTRLPTSCGVRSPCMVSKEL